MGISTQVAQRLRCVGDTTGETLGAPLHCARTARYILDQAPPKEPPSTPLPNALVSPLPQEHVPL